MRGKYESPRRKPVWLLIVLIVVVLGVGAGILVPKLLSDSDSNPGNQASKPTTTPTTLQTTEATAIPTTTAPPPTTEPEPEHVVATATIISTGDVLMHLPVINSGKQGNGSYDFAKIFQYIKEYTEAADYAAANLETTLAGTDNGYQYSGYPMFNCPDEIVDSAAAAGFDMLLTANNHCYDTRSVGLHRTVKTIREKGLTALGTMDTEDDPKYIIQDINGIKVGMLCYTYNTNDSTGGAMSLNGIQLKSTDRALVNNFNPNNPTAFYEEVGGYLEEMKDAGAEATVMFIHWGIEYQLKQNNIQAAIAQNLCNLGIDVIVGGHAHVVQPVDLLTSETDPDHKTVCLYSMGNAVSNQRFGNISYVSTAHTEDGVLFSVTFSKYSDGTVYLEETNLIPCWVRYSNASHPTTYTILPLDTNTQDQWADKFDLGQSTLNSATNSYNRTMAIVGEGLAKCQEYLEEARSARNAAYLAAVRETAG